MNLSMGYLKPLRAKLIEVFQRRNVIVHNNGIVHPFYLKKVDPALRLGITKGDRLGADSDYLTGAIDLVEMTFILIGAELWKKWQPEDADR